MVCASNTLRRPLTTAQQELATRYLPMARRLARPFRESWPSERDEFDSAALLALVEAAQSFDPSRNVRFATFARLRIAGALRDVLRRMAPPGWRNDPSHGPTVGSLGPHAENHGRVLNAEPDPPVGHELEAVEAVEAWLRKLPTRHAAACRLLYVHGKTQAEAAEALGCSQSRLCYMHRESLAMLDGSWYGPPADDDAVKPADRDHA
jgi:RNA polymerase sigma factor (sigma-70 family)